MHNWTEYLVAAVIVIGLSFAVFRGGQANPFSTGQISRRLGRVEAENKAMSAKIDELETSVDTLKSQMATTSDVVRLEMKIQSLTAMVERSWHAIDRMQNYWVEIGIGKR